MNQSNSKFPSKMTRYFDSFGAGGITIQGVELDTDEDGFVEAPAAFGVEMLPHGFLSETSKEYLEYRKANPVKPKFEEQQRSNRK